MGVNEFVRRRPFLSMVLLTPFTLAIQAIIDRTAAPAAELLDVWRLILAWDRLLSGQEWQSIRFITGQEHLSVMALALATEVTIALQLVWTGLIVVVWRWAAGKN